MQQPEDKTWIQKFGVSAPIKNIMNCVDDLEKNYELRLAELNAEYQRDVEDILENYRQEKQQFEVTTEEQSEKLRSAYAKLEEAQILYQTEIVEHKITRDKLGETRQELKLLSDALKTEQELIEITELKVKFLNEQMGFRVELDQNLESESEPILQPKAPGFLKKIFRSSKSKNIIKEDVTQEPVISETETIDVPTNVSA